MIPGVPNMGGMELLIILAIIMLFFGAKRVPQLGRSLGSSIREFRKGAAGVSDGKDEVEDHKKEEGEAPSLSGTARTEMPRPEAETASAEHKS